MGIAATEAWAAWACVRPGLCSESHCARCGEHVGGQGHLNTGFYLDGRWWSFAPNAPYECDGEGFPRAMRERYGSEPWVEDAIARLAARGQFRPDRRARAT